MLWSRLISLAKFVSPAKHLACQLRPCLTAKWARTFDLTDQISFSLCFSIAVATTNFVTRTVTKSLYLIFFEVIRNQPASNTEHYYNAD